MALSLSRMREQYLPSTATTAYVRAVIDGTLAAHAFVCRWRYKDLTMCWITQLVVDKNFRDLGLATSLLLTLKRTTDNIYGIMSSHPAACLAAAKAFYGSIEKVSLNYIATEADGILKSCPIPYIRDAKLHGTLFNDESEMVSGVDTGFFVDHDEPNAALKVIKADSSWPLGDLPEGHEFLLIIQHRRRSLRQLDK